MSQQCKHAPDEAEVPERDAQATLVNKEDRVDGRGHIVKVLCSLHPSVFVEASEEHGWTHAASREALNDASGNHARKV